MPPSTSNPSQPAAVTGVQLMQGIGHAPSQGFWADAWSQVRKRRMPMLALAWIGTMAFFAVFAPVVANGNPLFSRAVGADGQPGPLTFPLFQSLNAADWMLLVFGLFALPALILGLLGRGMRFFWWCVGALVPGIACLLVPTVVQTAMGGREPGPFFIWARDSAAAPWLICGVCALVVGAVVVLLPLFGARGPRKVAIVGAGCLAATLCSALTWGQAPPKLTHLAREQAGTLTATYTVIPFSPDQRFTALDRQPPGTSLGSAREVEPGTPGEHRTFHLGTDAFGGDVLTQLLHAARLALSIGVVSTGIALMIGVTMGALMGYFGGWIDLFLYRIVEIFMAVPVLFLLIVTVGILPPEWRSVYLIMAIVGCFTWTGMARYTRAEFLKLRNQDFVQAAKAVGVPLRSILFKHMLPNGVAPVLVDTSFAVATAITFEAVLSYLGLGPPGQASWGKLLSSAVSADGVFKWWLAVFPGLFIFLTVLSYNVLGEALRDAIDPKLKKAAV